MAGRALYLKQKISFKFLQVFGIEDNYEVLYKNIVIIISVDEKKIEKVNKILCLKNGSLLKNKD